MLRPQILRQLQQKTAIISFTKPRFLQTTHGTNTEDELMKKLLPPNVTNGSTLRKFSLSKPLEKYNRKSGAKDEDSDSEDESDPEFKDERDSKVIKTKVNSLRADLVLKAGLGIARNKIENIFYESKIRVNGKKLPKKSVQLNVGDEIDVIRGFSQQNPSHLVISRVVILSAADREEGFSVNLRRYKSLLIENYSGVNSFKSSAATEH
ncbi:hypothetical protein DOY81_001444 [Sarcophaga bullata]|nr:hypothetical protein DOY81_001444 [Sarcophaga bullata]